VKTPDQNKDSTKTPEESKDVGTKSRENIMLQLKAGMRRRSKEPDEESQTAQQPSAHLLPLAPQPPPTTSQLLASHLLSALQPPPAPQQPPVTRQPKTAQPPIAYRQGPVPELLAAPKHPPTLSTAIPTKKSRRRSLWLTPPSITVLEHSIDINKTSIKRRFSPFLLLLVPFPATSPV
jgi:hypothetical protein